MAWMRRVAATLIVLAAVGSSPSAPALAADPVVTVTPTVDLIDASAVTVTVDGLTADQEVVAQQCGDWGGPCAQPNRFGDTYPGNARLLTWTDGHHTTVPELWVQRRFTTSSGMVGCGLSDCTIRVTVDGVLAEVVPISFTPAAHHDFPDATLSIGPTTDLLDGQPLTGLIEHAPYTSGLVVRQCASATLDRCAPYADRTDGLGAGRHEVRMVVRRTFTAPSGPVDCTVVACTVSALTTGVGGRVVAAVPISFQADGSYDWGTPTLQGAPTTGLYEGASVHVAGGGYHDLPGEYALLQVCRAGPDPDPDTDCATGVDLSLDPDAHPLLAHDTQEWVFNDQTVEGTVQVFRHLRLPDGWYDCGRGSCTMALAQPGVGVVSERIPITFGPDWSGQGSPEAAVRLLVEPLYRRPLGTAERAALVADVADGTLTIPEASWRAVRDPSVDTTVGEAVRQYLATFGRHPEGAGLEYWIGRLEGGLTADQMARLFAGTPEGRATYAGLDTAGIVDRVYDFTLHRDPDPAGAAYWAGRLDAGLPLWKLVSHFGRSAENRATTAEDVLTAAVTLGRFGYPPYSDMWAYDGMMWVVYGQRGW